MSHKTCSRHEAAAARTPHTGLLAAAFTLPCRNAPHAGAGAHSSAGSALSVSPLSGGTRARRVHRCTPRHHCQKEGAATRKSQRFACAGSIAAHPAFEAPRQVPVPLRPPPAPSTPRLHVHARAWCRSAATTLPVLAALLAVRGCEVDGQSAKGTVGAVPACTGQAAAVGYREGTRA